MSDNRSMMDNLRRHGAPSLPAGYEYGVSMPLGRVRVRVVRQGASWWDRIRGEHVVTTAEDSVGSLVDRDPMDILVSLAFKAARQLKEQTS